ncbi:hypothetical protein [Cellvibrio sp. UBA7661]|uniref:hypothetical protein n=1 Tax=Cellvibrio sp. UBA7661 TaxID=1946311 RepID=UPI002F350901
MSQPSMWNLTDSEVTTLLGLGNVETYMELQLRATNKQLFSLPNEVVERISLLLSIWKDLQLLAPCDRQDLACDFFSKPNSSPMFSGKSIKKYLLDINHIDAFYAVKRYLIASGF